jgi:dTDP-4-amino-4,6-dideoxygalactose transaminase/nucleoside-diphosphate-sugar epimerase
MGWVVVGGAGFIGAAVCRRLRAVGETVSVVDVAPPPAGWSGGSWIAADLLTDEVDLPPGRVVLAYGRSMPRPVRSWTLALDNALATARLAPHLAGRDVRVLSTIEVYGSAPGPLREDTLPQLPGLAALPRWVDRALLAAEQPCPPHRVAALCQDLADLDASGRWVYALSKVAQEAILRKAVAPEQLGILRLANVVGPAQFRFLGRMVESVLEGRECVVTDSVRSFVSVDQVARVVTGERRDVLNISSGTLHLLDVVRIVGDELGREPAVRLVPGPEGDSCGDVDASRLAARVPGEDVRDALRRCVRSIADDPAPLFSPALAVVVPPRPERPDVVADRIAASLWSGRVRGARWSAALTERLADALQLGSDRRVVLTNSGTNALRLAVTAAAGSPRPGDVALCPAFTFHATAEVLRQLGWTVQLVDVDPDTWTMDPHRLASALAAGPAGVVVAVDSLGNPCNYDRLAAVCRLAEVPFVADSAPALGGRHAGRPVGTQADAHAFSMSFAKVVSGGGSGGFLVVPADAELRCPDQWLRSSLITEPSAIVALDGVEALEQLVQRRERVAAVYAAAVAGLEGFDTQLVRPGDRHAWVHWVTRVPAHLGADLLAAGLAAQGVETKPYYEPLAGYLDAAQLPVTTQLHAGALALPMSSELTLDDAERVATALLRVMRRVSSAVRVDGDGERVITLPAPRQLAER